MTEDLTIQLTRKNSGLSALAAGDRGWEVLMFLFLMDN